MSDELNNVLVTTLRQRGYEVKTIRNGWLVARLYGPMGISIRWEGEKRSGFVRAWADAAHHAGLGPAVAPL